MAEIIVGTRL